MEAMAAIMAGWGNMKGGIMVQVPLGSCTITGGIMLMQGMPLAWPSLLMASDPEEREVVGEADRGMPMAGEGWLLGMPAAVGAAGMGGRIMTGAAWAGAACWANIW